VLFVALVAFFVRSLPSSWVLPILAFTQVVFIRTVVVPSSARRTLVISALSALPVLGVVYAIGACASAWPGDIEAAS
jgi:hypothetical protein